MAPTANKVATGLTLEVGIPTRRRLAKAALAPRPLETGAATSSMPDTETTSAAPTGWVRVSGIGPLNKAMLDVQTKLRAEADAIKNCNKAYLASREVIRVCFLIFRFFYSCISSWGRASAPTECSPQVPGRLLSRRLGTLISRL